MKKQLKELLLQGLETELGGVEVYTTALECAVNPDLKEEWQKYLEQTTRHVQIMEELCTTVGINPEEQTPGRQVVHHLGQSLVQAMELALSAGDPEAAELVACECVVLAETKDHQNWELMEQCAKKASNKDKVASAIQQAVEEVEDQEDEHLYHTKGWARELWIKSLGMPAVIPPPEEEKHVKTAIGASRAEQARESMLPKH
jgi:hypothetical protein